MKKIIKKVAVTGAGGQISYSLLFRIANGDVFGPNVEIDISLVDIAEMNPVLEGIAMELEDCAFPLLRQIRFGSDPYELFKKIDCAFLVGAKPRGPGMERKDLLGENGKIFIEMGKALEASASKDVKVLVIGNPCNTNCLICLSHAPSISKKNFHAMMRLDENRAKALLAKKAGVPSYEIKGVVVWGNHSTTQVPDFTHVKIGDRSIYDVVKDRDWLHNEFMEIVQKRGAAIIRSRGKSSAASAASAAVDAMRALFIPTPPGEWFSSAVFTDNNPYGIENGLVFGFPCRSQGDGNYEIVKELPWDFFISEKIAVTQKELLEEKQMVKQIL